MRKVGSSPAAAIPTFKGRDSLEAYPADIEARLAKLEERESELRRREEEVVRLQRELEQRAASGGREKDLSAQAAELDQRRRRLEAQRATIEETLRTLANRQTADERQRAEVRQHLAEKLDLIRQRKTEFIEKVQLARAELKRRKLALARDRAALDEQVRASDERRQALERRERDLQQRMGEVSRRAEVLEQRFGELRKTAAEVERRGRTLAERAGKLGQAAQETKAKETQLRQRGDALDARAGELDQHAAALREAAAKLEQRDKTVAEREAQADNRREQLTVQEAELRQRAAELEGRTQQLDQRTERLKSVDAELDRRAQAVADGEAVLARQRDELAAQEAELDGHTQQLDQRAERLRSAETELDRRAQAVADGEAALARQRDELAAQEAELDGRTQQLDQRAERLESTETELDRREQAVADGEAEAARRRDEVAARDSALQQRATSLEASARKLDERAEDLAAQAAAISDRRRALGAREADLQRVDHELRARRQETEQEVGALDAAKAELECREENLKAATRALDGRGTELDAREADLLERHRALEKEAAELQHRDGGLETRRRELVQQAEALATQWTELEDRRQEVEGKESTLRERDREVDARVQQLESRERELEERAAECESEAEGVRALAAEVEQLQTEMRARAKELESGRTALGDLSWMLEGHEGGYDARRGELGADQEAADVVQSDLARQHEELAAWMRAVEERQAALEDRRAAVDRLYQHATEAKERARRHEQEAAALKKRVKARETELRRESLQTEIDREQVQRDHAQLIAQQERLADLQTEVEGELGGGLAEDGMHVGIAAAPHPAVVIPTTSSWRRGLALCTVMGLAAAAVCVVLEQPRYEGTAELRITSERGAAEWIAGEHADWLVSEGVAAYWEGPPAVEAWERALAGGRITARALPESGMLRLTLESTDRELAEALLPAAAKTYSAYVRELPLERFRSPRLTGWQERKAALEEELAQRHKLGEELEVRLQDTPGSGERTDAETAFDAALEERQSVDESLRQERERLVALQSQELPRGEVGAGAYQQALTEDAVYQEDLKEFRSETGQFRTELAVAMVLLVDPLQELRKAVQTVSGTMIEQRDLRPPANVRAVLEQCLAEIDDFNSLSAEFSQTWDRRRETIERLKADEEVIELVNQQHKAAEAAGRLVEEGRRVLGEIHSRIEGLSSDGDAGTREIVVASVLRGELSRLTEQVNVLAEAAQATDPSVNFRLDAHDRQVRGLRVRLRDRQEKVRQMLQAEADRAARAEHEAQERQLRETVSELDDKRQALMDALAAQLARLRELDQQDQGARELSAQLRVERAAVVRLEELLAAHEAERPDSLRDSVELVESRCQQVAGQQRVQNATLAGAATFVATGLLFLLMFAPRSQRQVVAATPTGRQAELEPLPDTQEQRKQQQDRQEE